MSSLYSAVKDTADKYSNKECIIFYDKKINYGEFMSRIDTFAYNLTMLGVKTGDVVTVCLPNSPSSAIVLYAVNKIGAIVNLVHPFIPKPALDKSICKTNSKLLIIYDVYVNKNNQPNFTVKTLVSNSNHFMPVVAKTVFRISNKKVNKKYDNLEKHFYGESKDVAVYQFDSKEPAIFLPSGGTTGDPKIIMHNCDVFNFLCSNAQFFLSKPVEYYRDKSMYSVLPMFHGYGLCMNMHMTLMQAVPNVMTLKFDTKLMTKAIVKHKVALLTGVPTMYKRLYAEKTFSKADLSSLLECWVGGDSVDAEFLHNFNNLLKKQGSAGELLGGYGLAEAVAAISVNRINNSRQGSVGVAVPETEFRIVDENDKQLKNGEVGEILICSPMLMLGYYKQKESPIKSKDGKRWLYTGDFGSLDDDKFLYFKQRKKNIIKVNGVPVFPSEIEEVLDQVEGVARCCAVGIKDKKRGEVVKLFVELTENANKKVVEQKILQTAKEHLIVYAMPKEMEFKDKLPINVIGKIDRKLLEK